MPRRQRILHRTLATTIISEAPDAGKTMIDYTYDFDESWEHRLTVSEVRPGAPGTAYPASVHFWDAVSRQ
jgi:hypothetical protein